VIIRYLANCLVLIAFFGLNLHGQEQRARFTFENNSHTNLRGVLFYNKNKIELSKIKAVTDNRKLVGWEPRILDFENVPADVPKPDFSRHSEDSWAFYYLGSAVASGSNAPSPEELANVFIRVGVPNRVHFLRTFLTRSPNNLDARLALMRELYKYAHQKTHRALNLTIKNMRDDPSLALGSTVSPEIKEMLNEEADLNIWGELSEMFNATFKSDDWLSLMPGFYEESQLEYMEPYSPTMKEIYKRNLPKVEQMLNIRQTDFNLWAMWQRMAQVTGRRILDFFPQLPTLPKECSYVWPLISVRGWMSQEARLMKAWSVIVENDWQSWPGIKTSLNSFAPINKMPETRSDAILIQKNFYWKGQILPLLEACLNNSDFDKATEIYHDIASRPVFESEAKLAFDMAKELKYTFPEPQVKTVNTPEPKAESFIGDPIVGNVIRNRIQVNRLKDLIIQGHWRLLIIDPSEKVTWQQIQQFFYQDKLPEYITLPPHITTPDKPEAMELHKRELLQKNVLVWGILDDAVNYHHGGNSPPTSESIMNVLNSINRKTRLDIFREFAKNNPESATAKNILLRELKGICTNKTLAARKDADGYLDGTVDYEIWGEFINVANSLFPHLLSRPRGLYSPDSFNNMQAINNSRLLQQLAARQTGLIENALQDRPHSRELWELWGVFSPFTPNRSLPSFLASLTPVPDLPDFPPTFLYPDLIQSYKSLEAWGSIINLVEPIWESYAKRIEAEENIKHRLSQQLLEQYINPLCEAYNKMGREQKAEKIRSDWKKAEGWS